jgi:FkbM family methyltransferase
MNVIIFSGESRNSKDFFIRKKKKYIQKSLEKISNEQILNFDKSIAIFAHDYIGHQINLNGFFEKEYLDLFKNFILPIKEYIEKGFVLDIGANIGNHTIYFSEIFSKIRSFEPDPDTFELLKFNTRRKPGISVFNFGLGREPRMMKISRTPGNLGASHIIEGNDEGTDVKIESVDNISNEIEVSLIKIDTEGFEFEVIEGSKNTIDRCMPLILFEQNKDVFYDGTTPSINALRNRGYEIAWIDHASRDIRNPVKKTIVRIASY